MYNEVFLVFGGYNNDNNGLLSTIAQFNPNTDTWNKLGDLNKARWYIDAITSEGAFLVIGDAYLTEKCYLAGNTINCVEQEPNVMRYG